MSKKTRDVPAELPPVEAPVEAAPPAEAPPADAPPAEAPPAEVRVETAPPAEAAVFVFEADALLLEFYQRPAGVHPASLAYLYTEGLGKVVMIAEWLLERGEVRRLGEQYQITPKGADRAGYLIARK